MGENTATAYVAYEITPVAPTVTWNEPSETVNYTGKTISSDKLPALTVTGVGNADIKNNYDTGDITYSYRASGSTEDFTIGLPTTCGTYEVKATVQKKGNYKEAETTEGNYLTLTIEWLDTEATATLTDRNGKSLTGNDRWAKSVTFIAPDGYTISWNEKDALSFQSVNADGFHAVKVATLTNDNETKDYVVYAYAVDKVGNRSGYICSDGIVVDDEAPTLTLSTPTKDDGKLTDSSATITLNTSEVGTYFYILKEDKEAAPFGMDDFATGTTANGKTTWEAKSGVTSGSMAEESNTLTLTGLEAKTDYVLYVMAVDEAGNASDIKSKEFTTLNPIPKITLNPQISGTYGQKLSEMSLVNGKAEYNGSEVEGTWTITENDKDSIYPTVNGTAEYEVTFIPTDTITYETITVKVISAVAKATPYIDADTLTAEALTYGQTLADSGVEGSAYHDSTKQTAVAGDFVWQDGSSKPTAKEDSNNTRYTVIFQPTDSDNYNVMR